MVDIVNTDYEYGFHMKKFSSFYQTIFQMKSLPMSAMQIYIKNSRARKIPPIDVDDIYNANKLREKLQIKTFIHGSLMYNLCGAKDYKDNPKFHHMLSSTIDSLTWELDVAVGLGAEGVIVHTGNCIYKEKGLNEIAKSVKAVLSRKTLEAKKMSEKMGISLEKFIGMRSLIFENCAGETTKMGRSLKDIKEFFDVIDDKFHPQLSVCIDTAHIFAAGEYDLGKIDEIDRMYSDFTDILGLNRLKLFHLNDSKVEFGRKVDRHENLGLGYIFGSDDRMKALKHFFLSAKKNEIPMIGEPPKTSKGGEYDFLVASLILDDLLL